MNFVLNIVNKETKELEVEECSWVDEDRRRKYFKYVRFDVHSKACRKKDKTPFVFVGVDDETQEFLDDTFFYGIDHTLETEAIDLVIEHIVEPIAQRLKKGFLYTMLEDADPECGVNIYVAPHAYAIEYTHEPGKIYPRPNKKFTEIHEMSKYYQFLFKCIWDEYEKKHRYLQGELRKSFLWNE